MKNRIEVKARISYFTPKGKHFDTVEYSYKAVKGKEFFSLCAHIRGIANDDSQHSNLPGLGGEYWAGPILVEWGTFKQLIYPEE